MPRLLSRRSVSTLLPFLATACSLGPEYQKPNPAAPAAWEATAAGAGIWPDPQWWRSFGNEELSGLVGTALVANQDLLAAVARIRQAEAQARIASAALWPTIGLDAAASRTSSPGGSRTVVRKTYGGSLDAAYQVDLFGQNRAAAAAGEVRYEGSLYDRETVALTVSADTATTWLQILAIRDRIRLAQEELRNSESILGLLEQQQRIGTISDLEVAQQRSAVALQRSAIPGLQQSERESLNALAVLLARLPQGFSVASRSLNQIRVPEIVGGIPSEVLLRRPDIRRAEADLRAANFDVQQARAARFPTITLTASAGVTSAALSALFGPNTWLTALAAGITAPLFEGGRLEAQEQSARARYEELTILYARAVLSSFRDVENALSASVLYQRQYQQALIGLDQARVAFRLADTRYRTGTVDFLTVLDAQRTVFQASDQLVLANLARFNARVDLYRALGGGWDGMARV
jgi:multidrug efflux system outer membrane protein